MGSKEHYAYGGRFLRAEVMAGKTATVVIEAVEDVQFDGQGIKPVLHFKNKKRGLVVNNSNFDILAAALGSRTEDWPGATVNLRGIKVPFKGKPTDSIVIEVLQKPAKEEQQPPVNDDPDI